MANGRVIARIAGDTATGAFTCVVRRAGFGDRSRYTVEVVNDAADAATIAIARLGETLHAMVVPGHTQLACSYTLPASDVPLAIEATCDGARFVVRERLPGTGANDERAELRRFLRTAAIGAASAALVVSALAAAVWFFWLRRRPKPPIVRFPGVAAFEIADDADGDGIDEHDPIAEDDRSVDVAPPIAVALLVEEPPDDEPDANETPDAGVSIAVPDPEPAAETNAPAEVLDPEPMRVTPIRRPSETWDSPERRKPSLAPVLAAFGLVAAAIVGFVLAHPHVGDLGAPNTVLEGSAIDVPYATSGIGALRYSVTSAQGTAIAGGPLADRSGVLHVAIPAVQHNEAYRIRLVLSGPLGDASNEATIGASALPLARVVTRTAAVPMIRSFAVSRSTVNGVPTVVAYYDVLADSGTLQVVDGRGIQYHVEPLSPSGQSTLALPAGADPATLALTLHAVRNGSAVDARIALPAGGPGTGVAIASPPPDPGIDRGEAAPISVPDRAVGGAPIRVDIVHHYPNLHVALLDANARKILGIDVPPHASSVSLLHPLVTTTTRMTVEATYRVHDEADTIVRPVLLIPAGG